MSGGLQTARRIQSILFVKDYPRSFLTVGFLSMADLKSGLKSVVFWIAWWHFVLPSFQYLFREDLARVGSARGQTIRMAVRGRDAWRIYLLVSNDIYASLARQKYRRAQDPKFTGHAVGHLDLNV